MRLVNHLVLRIAIVSVLCLVGVTAWIMLDARRGIDDASEATAQRAVARLQTIYWQRLLWRDGLDRRQMLPDQEWRTLETAKVIAPGVCVSFALAGETSQRLCNEAQAIYPAAPLWLEDVYRATFGDFPEIRRFVDVRGQIGEVVVAPDSATALSLVWLQIALMLKTATVMAIAISVLVAAAVAQALLPVRSIVDGLRRLEFGDYAHRIAPAGAADLGDISHAVNMLSGRLEQTEAVRMELTRQLFTIQEEERRALARDLHDEFGQCLAAVSAFAGSIEAGAADRPDLVADARSIASATGRMMHTLKSALARLRSQDIDELGLEACLKSLVAKWSRSSAGAEFDLQMTGDLAAVPRPVAISLYRIAQECLTNAVRHSGARQIRVAVDSPQTGDSHVALTVEDDGVGDPDRINAGCGFGLLGIRERIAALGGSFSIGQAAVGVRIAARIPFALSPPALGVAA